MYNNNKPKSNSRSTQYKQVKSTSKKTTKTTKEKTTKSVKSDKFIQVMKSQRMIQVYGIILMLFALLLLISIVSSYFHFELDASHVNSTTPGISNIAGTLGAHLAYYFISYTFGFISIGFPFLFFIYGYYLTFAKQILPFLT